jgi:hypothetical protein
MEHHHVVEVAETNKVPAYFFDALNDAERLLKYAAEIGMDVDADTRASILHARAVYPDEWTEDIGAKLLVSLTKLAAAVKPVTAESLKAYHLDTRPAVHTYLMWSIILASIIIPVSIATFVTSAISTALTADISKANGLAVKLRTELGPPPLPGDPVWTPPKGVSETDVIADLQDYASTVRVINQRARKLNRFIIPEANPPVEDIGTADERKSKFELPVGIPDPVSARDTITSTYQDVRYFALTLLTDVSVFYGAISTCILPVLYALLGTCAYLLRTFEHQMSSRTFTPSAANSARFLIAAIGGAVVGLFNNFAITEQASIPPLAIAFLVGYAVDVFFAFLEGLLTAFSKSAATGHTTVVAKS